jgi:hypothetical protein
VTEKPRWGRAVAVMAGIAVVLVAGFVAQLQAVKGSDGTYTVDVRNLGTQPFDGTLTTGVWLATDRNMLIAPTAVNARVLTFPESQAEPGRPTELRITLDLGGVYPTGKWTLPSS